MGNTVTQCFTGSELESRSAKGNLVILQANGQVLELKHSMRCEDLLKSHPYHFVCHSSSVLLKQQGSFLPASAKLKRGEIYFLLPLPGDLNAPPSADEHNETQALLGKGGFLRPQVQGTIKFVIPKQYLNRIVEEQAARAAAAANQAAKAANKAAKAKSSKNSGYAKHTKRRRSMQMIPASKKSSTMWTPGLESIVERD